MNPALTSYVLVDQENRPVPLPFHTTDEDGPVTITNYEPPRHASSSGRIYVDGAAYYPHVYNLRIISENEYMAHAAGRPPFHLFDGDTELTLPHTLPDDEVVTSVDDTVMVAETTISITWLDPAKYGLRIVADCDMQVTT